MLFFDQGHFLGGFSTSVWPVVGLVFLFGSPGNFELEGIFGILVVIASSAQTSGNCFEISRRVLSGDGL